VKVRSLVVVLLVQLSLVPIWVRTAPGEYENAGEMVGLKVVAAPDLLYAPENVGVFQVLPDCLRRTMTPMACVFWVREANVNAGIAQEPS
jgi:hypothetical protein